MLEALKQIEGRKLTAQELAMFDTAHVTMKVSLDALDVEIDAIEKKLGTLRAARETHAGKMQQLGEFLDKQRAVQ